MMAVRVIGGRPLAVGLRGTLVEYTGRGRQIAILFGVAVVFAAVILAIVWASFGFRYSAFAAGTTGADAFLGQTPPAAGLAGRMLSIARQFHILPEAYLYGSSLTVQFANERAAFLNGQFSTTGWWWYFPYAFAVKTTIPGMIVGLLALAAWISRRKQMSAYGATPLLALVAVYWAFALTTHLNIGHRHLLPIYPALCILAGGAAFWIGPLLVRTSAQPQAGRGRKQRSAGRPPVSVSAWRRSLGVVTLGMLAWHVVESVTIRPDYLAYFNQFAGGPSRRLPPPRRQFARLGTGPAGARAVARRTGAATSRNERRLPVVLRHRPSRSLRHPGHAARRVHRSSSAAAARAARPRRLLHQRHHARRRRPGVLQAGVREQLPGGVPEFDSVRPCVRRRPAVLSAHAADRRSGTGAICSRSSISCGRDVSSPSFVIVSPMRWWGTRS